MLNRKRIWLANFIILLACGYLVNASNEYGYCVLIFIVVAFTFNGFVISERLNQKI